jgi:hypothetical protein
MRLAIADPPYPPNMLTSKGMRRRASRHYGGHHPAAADWDDPARHRQLVAELELGYDGWALATALDAVACVYPPLPAGVRLMIWSKSRALPSSSRIASSCEAVIVRMPAGRRTAPPQVPDLLRTAAPAPGFVGSKPPAWTRWVLDAMGYDQDTDTVADLFPGSNAVTRELAQRVMVF